MLIKEHDIDFYEDGLNEAEFNCLDIPIAGACGLYKRDYYALYLLQLCVNANFVKREGQQDSLFDCLRNLGLEIKTIPIEEPSRLIDKIKEQIDAGCPVLLPVTYYEMFFCSRYKRNKNSHYLLAEGYFEETQIIQMREEINFISTEKLKDMRGLYPLRLKYDMVTQMWSLSRADIEARLKNRIFAIRRVKDGSISGYEDFIAYCLDAYTFEDSMFVQILEKETKSANEEERQRLIKRFRKDNYKYMYAFFHLLEGYIRDKMDGETYAEFQSLKTGYLNERELAVSRLHVGLLKNRVVGTDMLIEQANMYDKRLELLLRRIQTQLWAYRKEQELSAKQNDNLACSSSVTASSSESELIKNPVNVTLCDESIWKSVKQDTPHWICFAFPKETVVRRVEITHHPEAHKLTKDFCIQSSMDGEEWQVIEAVENNLSSKTVHYLSEVKCRFIRIYITMPGLRSNAAIIRHVRIT